MYSRLRGMVSANWGLNQASARMIYKGVFLPRVTYASRIRVVGALTGKAKTKLGSTQRRALLSMTEAYRTTSTDALQAMAGVLPLDVEIRRAAFQSQLRSAMISAESYQSRLDGLLDEWQVRWNR